MPRGKKLQNRESSQVSESDEKSEILKCEKRGNKRKLENTEQSSGITDAKKQENKKSKKMVPDNVGSENKMTTQGLRKENSLKGESLEPKTNSEELFDELLKNTKLEEERKNLGTRVENDSVKEYGTWFYKPKYDLSDCVVLLERLKEDRLSKAVNSNVNAEGFDASKELTQDNTFKASKHLESRYNAITDEDRLSDGINSILNIQGLDASKELTQDNTFKASKHSETRYTVKDASSDTIKYEASDVITDEGKLSDGINSRVNVQDFDASKELTQYNTFKASKHSETKYTVKDASSNAIKYEASEAITDEGKLSDGINSKLNIQGLDASKELTQDNTFKASKHSEAKCTIKDVSIDSIKYEASDVITDEGKLSDGINSKVNIQGLDASKELTQDNTFKASKHSETRYTVKDASNYAIKYEAITDEGKLSDGINSKLNIQGLDASKELTQDNTFKASKHSETRYSVKDASSNAIKYEASEAITDEGKLSGGINSKVNVQGFDASEEFIQDNTLKASKHFEAKCTIKDVSSDGIKYEASYAIRDEAADAIKDAVDVKYNTFNEENANYKDSEPNTFTVDTVKSFPEVVQYDKKSDCRTIINALVSEESKTDSDEFVVIDKEDASKILEENDNQSSNEQLYTTEKNNLETSEKDKVDALLHIENVKPIYKQSTASVNKAESNIVNNLNQKCNGDETCEKLVDLYSGASSEQLIISVNSSEAAEFEMPQANDSLDGSDKQSVDPDVKISNKHSISSINSFEAKAEENLSKVSLKDSHDTVEVTGDSDEKTSSKELNIAEDSNNFKIPEVSNVETNKQSDIAARNFVTLEDSDVEIPYEQSAVVLKNFESEAGNNINKVISNDSHDSGKMHEDSTNENGHVTVRKFENFDIDISSEQSASAVKNFEAGDAIDKANFENIHIVQKIPHVSDVEATDWHSDLVVQSSVANAEGDLPQTNFENCNVTVEISENSKIDITNKQSASAEYNFEIGAVKSTNQVNFEDSLSNYEMPNDPNVETNNKEPEIVVTNLVTTVSDNFQRINLEICNVNARTLESSTVEKTNEQSSSTINTFEFESKANFGDIGTVKMPENIPNIVKIPEDSSNLVIMPEDSPNIVKISDDSQDAVKKPEESHNTVQKSGDSHNTIQIPEVPDVEALNKQPENAKILNAENDLHVTNFKNPNDAVKLFEDYKVQKTNKQLASAGRNFQNTAIGNTVQINFEESHNSVERYEVGNVETLDFTGNLVTGTEDSSLQTNFENHDDTAKMFEDVDAEVLNKQSVSAVKKIDDGAESCTGPVNFVDSPDTIEMPEMTNVEKTNQRSDITVDNFKIGIGDNLQQIDFGFNTAGRKFEDSDIEISNKESVLSVSNFDNKVGNKVEEVNLKSFNDVGKPEVPNVEPESVIVEHNFATCAGGDFYQTSLENHKDTARVLEDSDMKTNINKPTSPVKDFGNRTEENTKQVNFKDNYANVKMPEAIDKPLNNTVKNFDLSTGDNVSKVNFKNQNVTIFEDPAINARNALTASEAKQLNSSTKRNYREMLSVYIEPVSDEDNHAGDKVINKDIGTGNFNTSSNDVSIVSENTNTIVSKVFINKDLLEVKTSVVDKEDQVSSEHCNVTVEHNKMNKGKKRTLNELNACNNVGSSIDNSIAAKKICKNEDRIKIKEDFIRHKNNETLNQMTPAQLITTYELNGVLAAGVKCTNKKLDVTSLQKLLKAAENSKSELQLEIKVERKRIDKNEPNKPETLTQPSVHVPPSTAIKKNSSLNLSINPTCSVGYSAEKQFLQTSDTKSAPVTKDPNMPSYSNHTHPVRKYLKRFVPFLLEGLLKLTCNRPPDPIQYLANWMIDNKSLADKMLKDPT